MLHVTIDSHNSTQRILAECNLAGGISTTEGVTREACGRNSRVKLPPKIRVVVVVVVVVVVAVVVVVSPAIVAITKALAEGVLPSHRGPVPFHARRRSVATRAPLHVVADLDRDFVSIVPRNPNHQRCLRHGNSTTNKKTQRNRVRCTARVVRGKFVCRRDFAQFRTTDDSVWCEISPIHYFPLLFTLLVLCAATMERTKWRPLSVTHRRSAARRYHRHRVATVALAALGVFRNSLPVHTEMIYVT